MQRKVRTYKSCRFRFSMADFRFWWQSVGNFAGKLLGLLPNNNWRNGGSVGK